MKVMRSLCVGIQSLSLAFVSHSTNVFFTTKEMGMVNREGNNDNREGNEGQNRYLNLATSLKQVCLHFQNVAKC